ncbi:leucine-rich_repeat domain-containing protein [Hexamita inflata]|uniref:Leucine-rich repeat domain-containing protein n=1 Tax=Hexamita inflata TaxID=28002 RepID=A0AA86QGP6_9EUKA|nr:leucine-rich repeat domain-containing protein [Hexamita inflata]
MSKSNMEISQPQNSMQIKKQKYNQAKIQQFEPLISNGKLEIQSNDSLKSLDFIESLDIEKLEIINCKNIQPKLSSESITDLTIENCALENIDFTLNNIQILNLNNNNLSTSVKICSSSFKQLKELYLNGNKKLKINNIQGLLQLQKLNMANCDVYDITGLCELKNLRELCLDENDVDLSSIGCLNLDKLYLNKCNIRCVQELHEMIGLKELALSYNKFDIAPLETLIQLTKLELSSCSIKNLDVLRYMNNLTELNLSSNLNIDINGLQPLTQLKYLDLSQCSLKDISSLRYLKDLSVLYLSLNTNIDLTPLQYLTKLTKLVLWNCSIKDVYALSSLINLNELHLDENQIVYIEPLKELKKLKQLKVQYNKILDLQHIQNLNTISCESWDQRQPSYLELNLANMAKDINNVIITRRKIKQGQANITLQIQNTKQRVSLQQQNAYENLLLLSKLAAYLFQTLINDSQ